MHFLTTNFVVPFLIFCVLFCVFFRAFFEKPGGQKRCRFFHFFFGKLSAFFAGNFRKKGRSFGNFFSGKFPVFLKAAVSRQMACWNAVPWTRDPLENRPVQSGCVEPGQVRAVDWASGATGPSLHPRPTLIEAVSVTNHCGMFPEHDPHETNLFPERISGSAPQEKHTLETFLEHVTDVRASKEKPVIFEKHVLGKFPRTVFFLGRFRRKSAAAAGQGRAERGIHCEDLRDKRANPAFVKSVCWSSAKCFLGSPRRAGDVAPPLPEPQPHGSKHRNLQPPARSFPAW